MARKTGRPPLGPALKRASVEWREDNLTTLAAALTYYGVLAIIPGLVVVIALLGLFGHNYTSKLATQVQSLAPGSSGHFVQTLILQAQAHHGGAGAAAIVGIVISLWSASAYVGAFRQTMNVIYEIGEGRPVWKTASMKLGLTAVTVVLLVAAALITVVSGSVADQVGNSLGVGHAAVVVWEIAKWPVLLAIVSILLAVLYWGAPNVKQPRIRWVSAGGVIATVLWAVLSVLFAAYVANFSSYNRTYGSLAGIIIFLVWLWLSNIAILFGAEVNAELDRARAIASGLPADVEPFSEPRDTRKMTPHQLRLVEESQRQRTATTTALTPAGRPGEEESGQPKSTVA